MSEAKVTVKDVADMPMGKEEFNDNKRKYEPIDCERNDTISEKKMDVVLAYAIANAVHKKYRSYEREAEEK